MNEIIDFITKFFHRGGLWVFLSSILVKLSAGITSVIIVHLLTVDEYGSLAFALSIMGFFTVFGGMGANWSLLRFGALQHSFVEKYTLFRYSLKQGSIYTVFLILFIIITSFFLPPNFKQSSLLLAILSLGILSSFYLENIKSFYRIIKKNRLYSKINIINTIIVLFLSVIFTLFADSIGYAIAYVLAPLITFLIFFKKKPIFTDICSVDSKSFFSYGINTGLGSIASQSIFLLGPLLAGYLNSTTEELAMFKVATIIPYNLMFIPSMIMVTDFVYFAENCGNAALLRKYYKDYLKVILVFTFVPFILLIAGSEFILHSLFGEEYISASMMMMVLNIGLFFTFLFRIPLGNILSAVGKANWNVVHSVIALIIFIPLGIFLYKILGILGIAVATTLMLIISGFVSLVMLIIYLKRIK